MRRRDFFAATGLATLASVTRFPVEQLDASEVRDDTTNVNVATKRLLFFDLWNLDYWDNCQLEQGTPEFVPEASYVDNSVPNQGAGKPSVYFDTAAGIWRMLYNIGWSPVRLMTATSEDGVSWHPDPHPELSVPSDAGGQVATHHVFTLPDASAGGVYQDPTARDGYRFKLYVQLRGKTAYRRVLQDANHPWHAIARSEGDKRYFHDEMTLVSKDGFHWKPRRDYVWSRPDWHPEPPYFGFYNRRAKRHVMIVRPGWGDRRIGMQTTDDFRTWSDPELLLQVDPLDTTPAGFYAMPVFPYDHIYVGLLWVFHNSSSRPVNSFNQFYGTMDAQLAYSYDGVRFIRGLRQPLLPLNPYSEHGCAQLRPYSMVEHDGKLHIYSGASRASHGRERTLRRTGTTTQAITLHRLRQDGWMYLRSKGDWARIQTKPLGIWSPEIIMNAAAPFGIVRYQVTDERSQPIAGFAFDDCVPLETNDRLDWKLCWKDAQASDLIGKVIRLELEFQNANIYSLTASYHLLDAQDQWLMKDGKPIDPTRFDY